MGKVKEIKRTANVAWSPRSIQSIYLAAGTVAQQLDASFNTTATLEIFQLDLSKCDHDMPTVGSIDTKRRFHKLLWSEYGLEAEQYPLGVVIGGSDNGNITIWNVQEVINSNSDEALIVSLDQHVGAVRALDVNPFQPNLIASGAGESEVFIWDLNNPSSPMSPGSKLHPLEDISGVAWNRQVQHILASTSPSGRSVVWDLRKNEPIIQVSDSNSRIRCKCIAWHPEVPTQLVTGSEDDRSPVVQMWDLRYATAPLRTLEHHQRGVLSVAWCPQDADLLLTAAKDNRVLCWNPNTDIPGGEVVYEVPTTSQWIFECHWCPRNPAIISTSSFDGHVTLYSLLGGGGGGGEKERDTTTNSPMVDSNDPFAAIAAQRVTRVESSPLKTPPKWFRRPCGARFGFGGQLVSFTSTDQPRVVISQVITEPELIQQSNQFETAMNQESYLDYCSQKIDTTTDHEQIWNFLKATFESEPRRHYLKLLGFSPEEIAKQINGWVESLTDTPPNNNEEEEDDDTVATLPLSNDVEDDTTSALFTSDGPHSPFDEIALEASPIKESLSFASEGDDSDNLLTRALLVGNFKAAVDICISIDRMSEALILSVAGGSDLFQATQKKFFEMHKSSSTKLISMITSRNWSEIALYGNLDNWREVLASLVTYATNEDFANLCDVLGSRLEEKGDEGCYDNAALCYVCSGNINKFVECCLLSSDGKMESPLALQELIEKVTLLRKAIKLKHKDLTNTENSLLSEQLSSYATLLANQGLLETALLYLEQTNSQQSGDISILHNRLTQRLKGPVYSSNGPHPSVTSALPTSMSSTAYSNTYYQKSNENPVAKGLMQPTLRNYISNTHSAPPNVSPNVPGMLHNVPSVPPTIPGVPHNVPSVPPTVPGVPHNVPSVPPTVPGIPHNVPNVNPTVPINEHRVPSTPPTVNMYAPPTQSTGAWNDPPSLRQSKKPTTKFVAPTPLTAPLGTSTDSVQQQPPDTPPITQPTNKSVPPPQPTPPPSHGPATPTETQRNFPPEHLVLYTIFNGLLTRCKARANNNVLRRKVDDINRKLEVFYDLICQFRLSQDVLQGLHVIAQDIQGVNYVSGLARLNHMVSTSNLSEIASFMPGIKTLLQLGMQLKV